MKKEEDKGIDVVKKIENLLQQEIDKYWEKAPIGYNKDNDAYHMGKSIMVKKEVWNKYKKALKVDSSLKPLGFYREYILNYYKKNKN